MQAIIDGFHAIIEGFQLIGEFIKNSVMTLMELIKLLTTIPTNLGLLTSGLPPWLMAVATTCIGISVVYMIVGRNTK